MKTKGDAAYPRSTVVERERSRRRLLLVGIGVLLLLSTSPLFGHHLPSGLEGFLAGRDHLWALCLIALHLLLAPVHYFLHALFGAGLAYALWERARAWRMLRRVLSPLDTVVPRRGDPFWSAARLAGVDPERIRVVTGLPTPAFTAGWRKPRIYAARELAERLSRAELAAVLAHEGAHVARRDPLRISALRVLSCCLFWIPALPRLAEEVADEAEILADDAAVQGRPLALATALLALAQWAGSNPMSRSGSVGFNDRDLLERRVRRLAGEDVAPRSRVTRRSLFGAAFALALAWTSGAVMAHPLPGETPDHADHCDQHASAPAHLFCLGIPLSYAPADCPEMKGEG